MKRDESQFEWRELARQWRETHTPSANLESQLVEEFRRKHGATAPKPRLNGRVWWLAAAAVFALIAGASVWSSKPQRNPSLAFDQPVPPAPLAPVPAMDAPKVVPAQMAVARTPAQSKRRVPAPRMQPQADEVVPALSASVPETYTEFFALEEGPISIDRGSVVRVRVPRSAMFRVGLPVNMNRMNDAIQADLVLSEDGIARAVRFVQ